MGRVESKLGYWSNYLFCYFINNECSLGLGFVEMYGLILFLRRIFWWGGSGVGWIIFI